VSSFEQAELARVSPDSISLTRLQSAMSERSGFCRQKLAVLKSSSSQAYVSPRDLELAYMRLGDAQLTFRWLEEAYKERTEPLLYLRVDPRFDFIRDDSRFSDLRRRVGL